MVRMVNYTTRTTCRICDDSALPPIKILDLGKTPLADKFKKRETQQEESFPLRIAYCPNCHLVQLIDDVNEEVLWNDQYAFYTGASPSSLKYFEQYASEVISRFQDLVRNGLTVEIASNDGTFLKYFSEGKYKVLGIEPTKNTAEVAIRSGVLTLVELFTSRLADDVVKRMGQASVIVGSNVLAHVPDLNDFVKGIKTLLTPDGVAIFEVQYFPHLLFNNAFDHVYHEHRSFFSLHPLIKLFEQHNMKIFDVQEADTQGGSIRIFVTKQKKKTVNPLVYLMLKKEVQLGIRDKTLYEGMSYHAEYMKDKLLKLLESLKAQGRTVYGFGASAKGNTLLNYCGITQDLLPVIVDLTPFKIGKFTPGTSIPVVSGEGLKAPDYYLVLVWNYLPGILAREKEYLRKGGHFIVPIPTPFVI